MPVRVRIPTPLRPQTGGRSEVAAVLDALFAEAPGLRRQLLADDGRLRSFVNLYRNGEDVRAHAGLQTSLADGDELAIVPAIAGGARSSHRPGSAEPRRRRGRPKPPP